jgi:hypothetical protein
LAKLVFTALASTLALTGAAASASESGGGAGGLHLVEMEQVSVPIIDGDRADGTLQFKLVLETKDDEAAKRVTATLPMLRATTLSAGIEFARLYASPMLAPDARRLATELTAALQTEDAGISRVLLVEVMASRS